MAGSIRQACSTLNTRVYNVKDDAAGIIHQAHSIQETRGCNVEDNVVGFIRQALPPESTRGLAPHAPPSPPPPHRAWWSMLATSPSHIHGGDLLPFRNLSFFLSQLVGRSLIIKLPKRVDSRKATDPKTAIYHLCEYATTGWHFTLYRRV